MKVRVDLSLCTGVGNCVAVAPKVFRMNEKRQAIVVEGSNAKEDTLWEAAESCPEKAVILEDDNGNQLYP